MTLSATLVPTISSSKVQLCFFIMWYSWGCNCSSLWHSCLDTWINLNTLVISYSCSIAIKECLSFLLMRIQSLDLGVECFPSCKQNLVAILHGTHAIRWFIFLYLLDEGWRQWTNLQCGGHRMMSGVHRILVWRIGVILKSLIGGDNARAHTHINIL